MSKFHVLIHSLLLVTSPSLLSYPQCEESLIQQVYNQEKPFDALTLTYDDILKLLQDIEEDKLAELSEEQSERMTHFIAFLARKGMLPEEYLVHIELENDIAALFENKGSFFDETQDLDYAYVSNFSYEYRVAPTLLNSETEAQSSFCKNKSQKKQLKKDKERQKKEAQRAKKQKKYGNSHKHHKHKNTLAKLKDFIVKHKKAIIIGAVVVVVASVLIVAVMAAAPSAGAVAAAGAAAAAAPDSDRQSHAQDPQEDSAHSATEDNSPERQAGIADLKSTIDHQIISFKESIQHNQFFQPPNPSTEQQSLSWEENGRALGSLFAHDSYQNLYYPESCPYDLSIPGANQDTSIGHSEIDQQFSTDYAYLFSQKGQEIGF